MLQSSLNSCHVGDKFRGSVDQLFSWSSWGVQDVMTAEAQRLQGWLGSYLANELQDVLEESVSKSPI